jgi:hypothetical protein
LVAAAFLVRSPLSAKARSISFGSMDRFVAMCEFPHMSLHIMSWGRNDRVGTAVVWFCTS